MEDPRYELVGPNPDDSSIFQHRDADGRSGPWYTRRVFQVAMGAVGGIVLVLIVWAIVRDSGSSSSAQALPSSGAHKNPDTTVVPHKNESTDQDTQWNDIFNLYGSTVDNTVDPNLYDYCSVPPLTYIETVFNGFHTLNVNRSLSRFYFEEAKQFVCCFSTVTTDDVAIGFKNTANGMKGFSARFSCFKDSHLLLFEEAVLVVCSSGSGGKLGFQAAEYKYIHHLDMDVTDYIDILSPFNFTIRNNKTVVSDDKLNFFVIGFESEAASNMMTKMRKTTQFFDSQNFVKLEKFAKISMNASLNRIAVTAGLDLLFARLFCTNGKSFSEDYCPLFNNVFKDQGYMQEDTKQSMDYYEFFFENGTDTCRGPIFSFRLFYDNIFNSIKEHKNFYLGSFKWMWRIREKDLKYAEHIDSITHESLDSLHRNGIFNNSVVIFLSFNNDTAFSRRIKPISERNDSFAYISLPQWFKEKYPQDMENLESNAKMMTTPYDLYFTVIDIMKKTTAEWEKKEDFTTCKKCGSLFNPIGSRTCQEAAVPLQYCLV